MSTVGERIKAAREAKGWSQERLGNNVGVSQQTIAKIEQSVITRTKYLPRLAQVLEVPLSALDEAFAVGLTPEPQNKSLPIFSMVRYGDHEFILGGEVIFYMHTPEPLFNVSNAFGLILPKDKWQDGFRAGDILLCGSDENRDIDRYSVYFGGKVQNLQRVRLAGMSIILGDGNIALERMTLPGADIVPEADWPTRYRVFSVWYAT